MSPSTMETATRLQGLQDSTEIYNEFNGVRAVIGGNVAVSYVTGQCDDFQGIWDTDIRGNVSFNNGSGIFETNFDLA